MKFQMILSAAIMVFLCNFTLLASNGEADQLKEDLIILTHLRDQQEIQRTLEKIEDRISQIKSLALSYLSNNMIIFLMP